MKNHQREKECLILGLGSDVLMDDGIGVRLMRDLQRDIHDPQVVFQTNLVGGMDIIELIRDYQKVVILDAMKTEGGTPGDVCLMNRQTFCETLHLSVSHDIPFMTALEMSEKLGIHITGEILIIGIEAQEVYTLGDHFSEAVSERYQEIRDKIHRQVLAFFS